MENYAREFLVCSYCLRYHKYPNENIDLIHWYFNNTNPNLNTCTMKAYDDLKRNLHGISSMNREEKDSFKESVYECIRYHLKLLKNDFSQEAFDDWHRTTCNCIIHIANENGVNKHLIDGVSFGYGIAQKWLNMAIKYLLVIERENDYALPQKCLHVPIDSYIYKAYSKHYKETEIKNRYALSGERAPVNHSDNNRAKKHSVYVESGDSRTQPWSKLNAIDYQDLQCSIRTAIRTNNNETIKSLSPIEWEGPAWIEQAKIEKAKRNKKRK